MDPIVAFVGSIIAGLIAVGGSIAVAIISGRNNRRVNEATAKKVESDAELAKFDSQLELQKFITTQVDKQVEKAVAAALIEPNRIITELKEGIVEDKKRLSDMATLVEAMTTNVANIKQVVRSYMLRLLDWQAKGLKGPMPMPIAEEVSTLEIEDIVPIQAKENTR